MNLDVKFKLLSSSSQIERDILKACEKEIRFILDKAKRLYVNYLCYILFHIYRIGHTVY